MDATELLSVRKVSEIEGVHRTYIYKLIKEGRIETIAIGDRIFIPKSYQIKPKGEVKNVTV
tara:strand:+ start:244 stop:426 length:183 start_codon:yes stop_codon:yes gene_type:complete